MESRIEVLLQESLSLAEKKFKDDVSIKKFEKIKEDFKELVSKGITHERGNNLLSPSDPKSFSKVVFNA
jgi:tRNA U54 and U55 pseudouridine synthase Pus10